MGLCRGIKISLKVKIQVGIGVQFGKVWIKINRDEVEAKELKSMW